jgi:hypothetical protein
MQTTQQEPNQSDEEAADFYSFNAVFINERWKDNIELQDHEFNEYIAKQAFLAGCQHIRQLMQQRKTTENNINY